MTDKEDKEREEMKMTYKDYADSFWVKKGNVKVLKITEKSVFVECAGITLRLRRSEVVRGAKINRYGHRNGSSYYIVIAVEEEEKK